MYRGRAVPVLLFPEGGTEQASLAAVGVPLTGNHSPPGAQHNVVTESDPHQWRRLHIPLLIGFLRFGSSTLETGDTGDVGSPVSFFAGILNFSFALRTLPVICLGNDEK